MPRLDTSLGDLLRIRDQLSQARDRKEICKVACAFVQKRLKVQAVSVFLFSRNGDLYREVILGVDRYGNSIPVDWYPDETHRPGQSFTGKGVLTRPNEIFARPFSSTNLDAEDLDPESRSKYVKLLGALEAGVVIPLNGRHRTFGTLEVINKTAENIDRTFSTEDVYWLSVFAMGFATRLSQLRVEEELAVLSALSERLIEGGTEDDMRPHRIYQEACELLVGPAADSKAVIVRVGDSIDSLEVRGKAGHRDVKWDHFINDIIPRGKTPSGRAYQSGKPVIVMDLEGQLDDFLNAEWSKDNQFGGYACFPLISKEMPAGTISLFMGYPRKLYEADKAFVSNVAALLAAYSDREKHERSEASRRQAERLAALAEQENKDRQDDIMNITHQLQGPLISVITGLTGVRSRLKAPWFQEDIGFVRDLAEDALTLCYGTSVTFAKQTGEESSFAPEAVDVVREVESLARRLQRTTGRYDLAFEYKNDPSFPPIQIDRNVFTSVVYSLIHNAIKYANEGTRVVLECGFERYLDRPAMKVKSVGVPIQQHERELIFQKFRRGHLVKNTGRSHRGMGIGLWVARTLIREMGGDLTVELSGDYPELSVFVVEFPRGIRRRSVSASAGEQASLRWGDP